MLDRLHQSCMSLSLWPSQVSFFYEPFIIISSLFVSLYVLHLIFLLLSFSIANIMQGRLFLPRNKQTFSSLQILQMIFQLLCRYLIFHSLCNKLHYIFNIILYIHVFDFLDISQVWFDLRNHQAGASIRI